MSYEGAHSRVNPKGSFLIAQVISKALQVYYRNIISFTLISAIAWLPGLRSLFWHSAEEKSDSQSVDVTFWLLNMFAPQTINTFTVATIAFVAFSCIAKANVDLRNAVAITLKISPNIFAISLFYFPINVIMYIFSIFVRLHNFEMVFVWIVFLIPSFYFATQWYVAVSACIIENIGPLHSLARSRDLTKGWRWKIFAFLFGLYILNYIGQTMQYSATVVFGSPGQVVAGVLWQGIAGAFDAVSGAAIYYYLRVAKEGADVAKFGAVFD